MRDHGNPATRLDLTLDARRVAERHLSERGWDANAQRRAAPGGAHDVALPVRARDFGDISHEEHEGRAERPVAFADVEADQRACAAGLRNVDDQRALAALHEQALGRGRVDGARL